MEFFRIQHDIPFMKHALVFNVISLVTFLLAVFFLATRGLNLGVWSWTYVPHLGVLVVMALVGLGITARRIDALLLK